MGQTAVEWEPIGHSKTSLNPDSVHCIRSSNKNEEQQNNCIHIKPPKNSRTSIVFRKSVAEGTSVQVIHVL